MTPLEGPEAVFQGFGAMSLVLVRDQDESCASHLVRARGDWGHLGRGSQPRKISSAPLCDKSLASKGQINAGSARDGGYGAGGRVPRPMGEGYLVSSEGVASVNHAGQLSPSRTNVRSDYEIC